MASPFKVFRKNQKVMLALLGVLVMFGFVILPAIMDQMGERPAADPRVATTSEYGPLRASDLQGIRRRRQVTIRFLEAVARAVRDAVVSSQASPQQLQMALGPVEMAFRDLTSVADLGPNEEEALVETWLLARRAEDLGLVVDDLTIRHFIDEITQGHPSKQRANEAVKSFLNGMDLSADDLSAALRQELLAMQIRGMFRGSLRSPSPFTMGAQGLPIATPAERWDYFQRLKRKVSVQSIPVAVPDFLDDVPDPDEGTLLAFFDQYKYEPYDPTTPEVGFREPKKITIEYFKAEYETFFDRQREAISQEEIAQLYEKRKQEGRYKREKLPSDEKEPSSAEAEPKAVESEQSTAPEGPADAEASTEPVPSAQPEPSTESKPPADTGRSTEEGGLPQEEGSGGQPSPERPEPKLPDTVPGEPPAEPPAESPAESSQQPAETESTDQPAAGSTDPSGDAASPDDSSGQATSARDVSSPFRLASLLEEDEETEADESTEPDAPPVASQEATEEAPPAEPPVDKPTAVEEPSGKPEPAEPSAGKEAPAEPSQPETAPAEPDEYLALEEVEDEIRRELGRERANEEIESLLGDLRNKLSRYHDQLILDELDRETGSGDGIPPSREKPDWAKLAEENGLVLRKKGLISAVELGELDIGKSTAAGGTSFVETAMELPINRAEIAHDGDGNAYLFWKTGEADPRVPELDEPEVRRRVVRQWKMIEARGLAIKEAERLAAEAREADKPLGEVFADDPAVAISESEVFTWLTYGSIPAWMAAVYGPPRISEVKGVEAPGHDFMRAVFALEKGEIGTAMNGPQTVAYVIQVIDSNPLPESLWASFKYENYGNYYRAADHDQYSTEKAWLDAIKSEAGFEWDPEWKRESTRREARS